MSALEIESECVTLITWKLANFSSIASRDNPNKELKSDTFQLDSSGIKCCLLFCPTTKKGNEDKQYSSMFIHVVDFNGNASVKIRYRFWVKNESGDKLLKIPGINL
jgi:hypothetical protein